MSSLLALLSQQTPNLQTRKGLILLGLQNDFVSRDGKLPVKDSAYLDRLTQFVSDFREFGDLIWVRSEFESTRPVNGLDTPGDTVIAGGSSGKDEELPSDKKKAARSTSSKKPKVTPDFILEEGDRHADDSMQSSTKSSASFSEPDEGKDDEELFLSRTSTREPCCLKGTRGADYADRIKPLVRQGKDMQVVKTHYSAFGGTSLLLTLRSKLITELYVAGNMTNLSVYATAMDAARYGIRIILVEDCLGYRRKDRHKLAIEQLCDIMMAEVMTSRKAIDELRNPPEDDDDESEEASEASEEDEAVHSTHNTIAATQVAGDLEADSDESDGEVELPIVRRSGMLGAMTGRSSKGTGTNSLKAAFQEQRSRSQHSQSAHSGLRQDHKQASRSFERQSPEQLKKPQVDTDNTRHYRRLGILDSPESPPQYAQPWLDIIPRNLSSHPNESTASPRRPKHPGLAALSAISGLSSSTVAEYEDMMRRAQENMNRVASTEIKSRPLFGEDKQKESRGSRILYDLLPSDLADVVFDQLQDEVSWQTMYHQTGEVPRLVCCQGTVGEDGSTPVYRHPSDQTIPLQGWTATVDRVRKAAEEAVGHPLNHALIQLYRGGDDFISEHSDKTLDIVPGSNIVNVSFGAQRTMRLRTKRGATPNLAERTTYRVPLPHNSMITMSLETNAQYLHGINADKRPDVELVEAEKAYGGHRISLTFRHIGTFLSGDSNMIWGQGAVGKTKETARSVVNGDPEQSEKMVKAFGAENAASSINWQEIYGGGTDVLHLK